MLSPVRILGIDLGGTKIAVCAGDETGRILASARMPTAVHEGPFLGLLRTGQLAEEVLKKAGWRMGDLDAVGISAPGPVSLPQGILHEPPNMAGWGNLPLLDWARSAFSAPAFMDNDANACALAEYLFGEHKGAQHLAYITLSTGLGAGLIVNGRVVRGATGFAGEIGHHVLVENGRPCSCGLRGCLEAYCGGRSAALYLRERVRAGGILADAFSIPEDQIDFKAFAEAVRAGNPHARAEWDHYVERLAHGIGTLIMILNPEVIFLGTIAWHTGELLLAPLRERVKRYAWESCVRACVIRATSLGERIGDLSALAVAVAGRANED